MPGGSGGGSGRQRCARFLQTLRSGRPFPRLAGDVVLGQVGELLRLLAGESQDHTGVSRVDLQFLAEVDQGYFPRRRGGCGGHCTRLLDLGRWGGSDSVHQRNVEGTVGSDEDVAVVVAPDFEPVDDAIDFEVDDLVVEVLGDLDPRARKERLGEAGQVLAFKFGRGHGGRLVGDQDLLRRCPKLRQEKSQKSAHSRRPVDSNCICCFRW